MLIGVFSLMSSMYTNIFEQTKEIGILRAMGINKSWLMRIYIYESFILVFSSSVMGMIIGTIVSYTMVLQRVSLQTALSVLHCSDTLHSTASTIHISIHDSHIGVRGLHSVQHTVQRWTSIARCEEERCDDLAICNIKIITTTQANIANA